MEANHQRVTRVGVFYDGNFFVHVSNYYRYHHDRKARISIPGLHEFIRERVASSENSSVNHTRIIDAHFFRSRINAKQAEAQQKLYAERVVDDILMSSGVTTHYMPVRQRGDRAVDVWLALDAYEMATAGRFDVFVLVGGDGDFVPLIRKIQGLGVRVMVLGWDLQFIDDEGIERETVTSRQLLDEAIYPVLMQEFISDEEEGNPILEGLFVDTGNETGNGISKVPPQIIEEDPEEARQIGAILSLKDGYGFIRATGYPNNLFFHSEQLEGSDFSELAIGTTISFVAARTERGDIARHVRIEQDLEY